MHGVTCEVLSAGIPEAILVMPATRFKMRWLHLLLERRTPYFSMSPCEHMPMQVLPRVIDAVRLNEPNNNHYQMVRSLDVAS